MAIPATHKAKTTISYDSDDGTHYPVDVPEAWAALHLDTGLTAIAPADLGSFPEWPFGRKPRHFRAETTDGTDQNGDYHVYSRNFVCSLEGITAGGPCDTGKTFAFEGCVWIIKGRVGEKHYQRG